MRGFLIFIFALLVGCASSPASLKDAAAVPQGRLLPGHSQFAAPSPRTVMITVVRDSGFGGSALAALLSIDAVDIAKLRASERIDLYVKPGVHIFGVVSTPNAGAPIIEESYDIQPGQEYFFRVSTGNGPMSFQRSARIK